MSVRAEGMGLGALVRPELIFPDLAATGRTGVLRALAERLATAGLVKSGGDLYRELWEREQLGSTAVGGGVAIPHCKLAGLSEGIVALGVARDGVDFGAPDGKPVKVFFVVVSPSEAPGEHLQVLAAISRWLRSGGREDEILSHQDPDRIFGLLQESG